MLLRSMFEITVYLFVGVRLDNPALTLGALIGLERSDDPPLVFQPRASVRDTKYLPVRGDYATIRR